jgi:NADPH2:quinone reductase
MRLLTGFLLILFSLTANADTYRQILMSENGGPEVLELVESAPLPEPGPGEVRVRVLSASASFTDIMLREGLYPVDADLPYPPGYDLVGVVDKLGAGVSGLAVGDRVADLTVWGAYTEYALRPANSLVPVPAGIGSNEAVMMVLSYMTAYQMLHRIAEVEAGQTVLIHGASGAVGTALAQLGRLAGLTMYGTASTAKQDYVADMGVAPIDYKTEDFVVRINEATGGAGVDVVFDAIGVDNFERSYETLKPGGLLVEYGLYLASLGKVGMIGEFIGWSWQRLIWSFLPEDEKRYTFYSIADLREEQPDWFTEDLSALFTLLGDGKIRPRIWKVMPLEQAAEAHRLIEAGQVRGKIVLQVSAD